MRILLISDSHGNKKAIDKLFDSEKFDYLFFLGDGLGDIGCYDCLDNVICVSGNCDFFSSVPNERLLKIGDFKILATHGNKYGVKSSLNKLIEKSKMEGVNFVFFGHTHRPTIEMINGVYYVNPGSFHKNAEGCSLFMEIILDGKEVFINQCKVI